MTAPTGHTDVAPIAAGFVLVDTGGWLWIRTVGAPRRGRVVTGRRARQCVPRQLTRRNAGAGGREFPCRGI